LKKGIFCRARKSRKKREKDPNGLWKGAGKKYAKKKKKEKGGRVLLCWSRGVTI